jgi:hypothetical protein
VRIRARAFMRRKSGHYGQHARPQPAVMYELDRPGNPARGMSAGIIEQTPPSMQPGPCGDLISAQQRQW